MEKYIYVVYENYDVDGGIGDAIRTRHNVASFLDEKLAKEYVDKYSNSQVYAKPYSNLYRGGLDYEKVDLLNNTDKELLQEKDYYD